MRVPVAMSVMLAPTQTEGYVSIKGVKLWKMKCIQLAEPAIGGKSIKGVTIIVCLMK